jgi:hypothetical protein
MSLYWFGTPESKTLHLVVGADCLRIVSCYNGVALPALYWPADKVGARAPSRLRPGDLSLIDYNC